MKPTLENIDQWLFDALEGNLSPAQEQALEDFIAQNPELELEQQAWLKSDLGSWVGGFLPSFLLEFKLGVLGKEVLEGLFLSGA